MLGVDTIGMMYGRGRQRYPGLDRRKSPTRHPLTAGTAAWFELAANDVVTVFVDDPTTEIGLLAINEDNVPSLTPLDLAALPTTPFDPNSLDARELKPKLQARNIELNTLAFGVPPHLASGENFCFRAVSSCALIVLCQTGASSIVSGDAPGDAVVEIARAQRNAPRLPDPLGEIREEFTVMRGTAMTYDVKAGEYVQIIDIEGQQCSDFMAFDRRKLDLGLERFIDSTVTRSIVGGAYPMPGLADKFFDQDMSPLLAVTQDTMGRHDTFALACTARGYEERGYPGHVNCSDNISRALAPYGIASRAAWPAINLFFNSWISPTDTRLYSDESWSRAGDYVAMRALSDLVCVSTACPNDMDPINGWNPTDIHVRVYKPGAVIRRAVAYRPTTESQPIMTAETPFHPRTSALTQQFSVARDHWMPQVYEATGAIAEYWACRQAVTVQDMSGLRKLDIVGPDAMALLQTCMTRDVQKLSAHRGIYALICENTGAVIDDGTLFRLSDDAFRWCCGSDRSAEHLRTVARAQNYRAWVRDRSETLCNLAIQGPRSGELLSSLLFLQPTQPRLENLRWFGFAIARLRDRNGAPMMLTRTGFTGELGYEIFCDRADALSIWDVLVDAGASFGLQPMGAQALNTLRTEAGLMVAGAEFGDDVDPDEAGLGFAVDMSKGDFIGKDAIARNRSAPRKALVGLRLAADEVPSHGDGVFVGRNRVGIITSATRSPELGHVIAMARVAVECASEGKRLEIGRLDGEMKRLDAHVVPIPFIDPKRKKPRTAPITHTGVDA